ncbi:MAG: hypothetical protein ABEI86_15205 [Halobacteriaceae archaeon]
MKLNIQDVQFTDQTSSPSMDQPTAVDSDAHLEFSAGRYEDQPIDLEGFNEYGVRENRDENDDLRSVDVVYEAMEPGDPDDRNGVRITEEFLREVASKDYTGQEPYMLGHSDQPLDEVGKIRKVWFSEEVGKLMLMNRVFNTGAPTHEEVVKRLTYDPPTMTDGSVGLGNQYEAVINERGEPELVDGTIREFSTVPFPGGYDNGGLGLPNAAFAEQLMEGAEVDDGENEEESPENSAFSVTKETISF